MKTLTQKIFLIDGLGALVSAALLGVALPALQTGVPRSTLLAFAIGACVFAIYSLTCFLLNKRGTWLKAIAVANLLYCGATGVAVWFYFSQMTSLGRAYFLMEIAVIVPLAVFELKQASLPIATSR